MKNFIVILIVALVVKTITLFLQERIKPVQKEYEAFYKSELFKKYQKHEYEYSVIKAFARDQKIVPNLSQYFKIESTIREDKTLYRTWFQELYEIIQENYPDMELVDTSMLIHMPNKLKNTVKEEQAKDQIFKFYETNNRSNNEYLHARVKGVITEIIPDGDSLSIFIKPYVYSTNFNFDECVKSSENLVMTSFPFLYKGALKDWLCRYTRKDNGEIYEVKFD